MKKSKKIRLSLNKKIISNLEVQALKGGSETGMWCPQNGNYTVGCGTPTIGYCGGAGSAPQTGSQCKCK